MDGDLRAIDFGATVIFYSSDSVWVLEKAGWTWHRVQQDTASSADAQVLEAAVAVVSRELDALVGACLDADGKPCAPDRGAVMRARSMLPPACKHALKKA